MVLYDLMMSHSAQGDNIQCAYVGIWMFAPTDSVEFVLLCSYLSHIVKDMVSESNFW